MKAARNKEIRIYAQSRRLIYILPFLLTGSSLASSVLLKLIGQWQNRLDLGLCHWHIIFEYQIMTTLLLTMEVSGIIMIVPQIPSLAPRPFNSLVLHTGLICWLLLSAYSHFCRYLVVTACYTTVQVGRWIYISYIMPFILARYGPVYLVAGNRPSPLHPLTGITKGNSEWSRKPTLHCIHALDRHWTGIGSCFVLPWYSFLTDSVHRLLS